MSDHKGQYVGSYRTEDTTECTEEKPCGLCCFCENEKNKKPQVELDGEITLYESSLGWLPFKE